MKVLTCLWIITIDIAAKIFGVISKSSGIFIDEFLRAGGIYGRIIAGKSLNYSANVS